MLVFKFSMGIDNRNYWFQRSLLSKSEVKIRMQFFGWIVFGNMPKKLQNKISHRNWAKLFLCTLTVLRYGTETWGHLQEKWYIKLEKERTTNRTWWLIGVRLFLYILIEWEKCIHSTLLTCIKGLSSFIIFLIIFRK